MIQSNQHGPVKKFRLARSFGKGGLYFTTAYWVDGLLIDTGCRHTVPELIKALEKVPIHLIVNTHSHEDHIAGNAPLQSERRVDILAHPLALPVLADPRGKQPLNVYRKVMWGTPDPSRGKPLGEKIRTDRHTFRIIPTPGHSPDHICLAEKVLTLHRQGMPIRRIRRRLLGREPLMAYLTLGHFSGYGLIRSFIVNRPLNAC